MSRSSVLAIFGVAFFAVRAIASIDINTVRHTLKEVATYDEVKMVKLVQKEINLKEEDDNAYLENVATVLAETVLIQPDYGAREAGLKELRGKLEPEEFPLVVEIAASRLLAKAQSPDPAVQATVFVALTNLVTEARAAKKADYKATLQKIADANLVVSDEARNYARYPIRKIISPSVEAKAVLENFSAGLKVGI
jgi:hypothetical protein